MDAYALGVKAAKLVPCSMSIKVTSGGKQHHDALKSHKARNSGGPWRQGRKPQKRKSKDGQSQPD